MSGGFNQTKQGQANWQIFVPQGSKGKYQKYANRLVVIVSITEDKKGNISHGRLYFTDAIDNILQHPDFVKLGMRGSNVGIIPMEQDDGECYVVARKGIGKKRTKDEAEQTGMAFVSINAFAKYYNMKPGVYEAHSETGVIVFDTQSMPSRA
jgi:hypothetical protein